MDATYILVLRHGDTDKSQYGDIFYGVSVPIVLSNMGRRQLKEWGQFFKSHSISAFYCSPLKRARQSLLCFKIGYYGFWRGLLAFLLRRYRPVADLIDVAYPRLEGCFVEGNEIILDNGSRIDLDAMDAFAGEPLDVVGRRFAQRILGIAAAHRGELVVVISHGDTIAHGLHALTFPDTGGTTSLALSEEGKYPSKGELTMIKVSSSQEVEVVFRPQVSVLRTLLS